MNAQPKETIRYILIGAINPSGRAPAICVPAFNYRKDNSTYLQYIDIENLVGALEVTSDNEWESFHQTKADWSVAPGDPAIHCIAWTDDLSESLIGPIHVIRSEVLQGRWRVDNIDNPFERLDFAQLSGHKSWFSEEARHCESCFSNPDDLRQWLMETLLLSRVRFAVDSMLVRKSAPMSVRRRLGLMIRAAQPSGEIDVDSFITKSTGAFLVRKTLRRCD